MYKGGFGVTNSEGLIYITRQIFHSMTQIQIQYENKYLIVLFSLLHRACCRVTQLLYQLLHIYEIYKTYTLKMLRHVSVLGPSSGSHIVLAPRTETCRSIFNVLMCKFYICAVVGIIE